MNRRAISAFCASFIVLGAAAIGFKFFWFGYAQCHPRRTPVSAAESQRARESLPGLTGVTFRTRDAQTLRGWYVAPKNGVTLVLVHGLMSNRAGFLPEAAVFARHGYGILLYDSRAHGESTGDSATWGYLEAGDVAQAVAFVRSRASAARVALLGFSVGASAVARAAADDPSIAAVILYATWPSLREEVAHKQRHGPLAVSLGLLGYRYSGTEVDDVHPEQDLARIAPRPLLFVSGGEDTDTPPAIMDRMYAKASGPKEHWRVPEAGHGGCFAARPVEYEERVVGFLDRATGTAR